MPTNTTDENVMQGTIEAAKALKTTTEELKRSIAEQKNLSDEQMNKVNAQVDELKKQYEDMQKAMQGISTGGYLAEEEKRGKKFSFAKAASALKRMTHGMNSDQAWDAAGAGFEKEILVGTVQKAQTEGTPSAGGYLVPTELANEIIELVYPRSVIMEPAMKITNIAPGIGQFEFPRMDSGATAYWLGELAQITDSALTFGKVTLSPNKVAAFVMASNELITDSPFSLEQIVRADMSKQLANAFDNKAFMGDGTSNTPTGIINTSGVLDLNSTSAGDACTWQTFKNLRDYVDSQNTLDVAGADPFFVSNANVINKLTDQTIPNYSGQTDGLPLFVLNMQAIEKSLGVMKKDGNIPQVSDHAPLFFGDFSQLIVATWGNIQLDADKSYRFQNDEMAFRATMRADVAVRNVKAFVFNSSVKAKTFL